MSYGSATALCAIFTILVVVEANNVENAMSRTLPAYALASRADLLNSTQCAQDLRQFRNSVDRRVLWALKILDASGEAKPGFIYGNNYWLGVRSQCLDSTNRSPLVLVDREKRNNSNYRDPDQEFPPYPVNYFVAYFRHNSTIQYHVRLPNEDLVTLGLCLPDSCTTDDLGKILESIFHDRTLLASDLYSTDFKLTDVRDLKDDHQWLFNGRIILVGAILIITWTLMIIGTAYDVIVHQKNVKERKRHVNNNNTSTCSGESKNLSMMRIMGNGEEKINKTGVKRNGENTEAAMVKVTRESLAGRIVLCFSVYSNTRELFSTKLGKDSVPAIHGLRFLGMVWIIMIHTIFYMSDYVDNKPWSWRMAEGFAVQVISNSTLSVDTYFFLSGFLVAYLYFLNNKGKSNTRPISYRAKASEFFVTILRRFIRLTPAYMVMVGILDINSSWYGKTSLFHMTERPQEVCAKYWWRNILYINNLFGRETMCMSWSWYLSNDMQFFIIGSFLMILSSIYFYTAVSILISLLLGSIAITSYIAYSHGYVPTMDEQYNFLDILYDPPWTRIGPYIIGIMTAYIIVKINNQLNVKRRILVLCWFIGSSCNVLVLFGLWERHIPVVLSALYVGFSRTIWGVGIGWLLIACCTKHGGVINKILSFKGWVPLSRLTYCAYLLNPFLINSVYLHSESSVHVDFLPNGTTFLGIFVSSYFCAYALSLMLETPYVLLMRMLINSRTRKK